MSLSKLLIKKILGRAGLNLNGNRPFDVRVNDERFYDGVLTGGTLFIGEAYMKGWWDSDHLDETVARLFSTKAARFMELNPKFIYETLKHLVVNPGKRSKAREIADKHYDIGNDLFEATLGRTLAYTCGYWQTADSLDAAQEAKQDLICRKLGMEPGKKLLDIGCGWGGFAKQAAENFGVNVVGITVSQEQAEYARRLCTGLPVEIRVQDYRDIDEKFDYISVVGMIEHVGSKNYDKIMKIVERYLKAGGRFLLHTIGKDDSLASVDPWIAKYIFPNSEVPIRKHLKKAIGDKFEIWDWHEFGEFYDPTLMAWYQNFERAWPRLKLKYESRADGMFRRMWRFYLLASAAAFRAGRLKLWQILLSKEKRSLDYRIVR